MEHKNFCECGCAKLAKAGNRFIIGHNMRGKNSHRYGKSGTMKGKHHTAECIQKMSETRRGKKRKPFSAEHRKKLSEANKGKHHSAKSKRKMSIVQKGKNNGFYGKHHTAESNKKNSDAHKGKNIGKNNPMFGKHRSFSAETLEIMRKKGKKYWQNLEYRETIIDAIKTRWQNPEYKQKFSKYLEVRWQDSEYRKMMKDKLCLKPNLLEKDFGSAFPELKFVGDFSFFVGSKNPDFILPGTNVCVDMFGDYWHKPEEVHERQKHFKEFGYELHIFWEHEWKQERLRVISQVNNLIQNVKELK